MPGVYTRVSFYIDWIERIVCENSDDPPAKCSELLDEDDEEEETPIDAPTTSPANGADKLPNDDIPDGIPIVPADEPILPTDDLLDDPTVPFPPDLPDASSSLASLRTTRWVSCLAASTLLLLL